MKYIALSKELLNNWADHRVPAIIRQEFLLARNLSIVSTKTGNELSFMADCAYVWTEEAGCLTMKWEEFYKLKDEFSFLYSHHYRKWSTEKPIDNEYENRLQKQKADVVRGDDTEGNRVQGRVRKITVTVGHLSHQAVKG